ncbi:hypothetical protein [Dyella sp. ASV21]|uniref:HVO_A0114 family putative DNA-binding protein n=1 Tax=Dyella sp. ASV21 TaxID=2795114 RepID=UPI0018ED19FB|nr:hypothetical protein [Dyella sp. ASV21]
MFDRVLTMTVSPRSASRARFIAASNGERQCDYVVFKEAGELARLLTESRVRILESMAGKGTLSIRQVARLVGRNPWAVCGDVRVLVGAGVLTQNENGAELAYGAIHVDFFIDPRPQPAIG